MIAAIDVHYFGDRSARAAVVLFQDYAAADFQDQYTMISKSVEDYQPGFFYRRELPCILNLLKQLTNLPTEMIIDGYVNLADRPGLGAHLYAAYQEEIPVIGVAKNGYQGVPGIEVCRGQSRRPLFVTAAGIDPQQAAANIRSMAGHHRLPTLLKKADQLARQGLPSALKPTQ